MPALERRRFGLGTATLVVIANMVGTGVFTTSGLLLADVHSPLALLLGWAVGGLVALCGALAYGELASSLPANGGEYRFLSALYHPCVGFVAGWLSLVVGFSAPIAASARAFGEYVHAVWPCVSVLGAGALLVVAASLLHAIHVRGGAGIQNLFALLKAALILGFVAGGLFTARSGGALCWEDSGELGLLSPAFAVGLIYISFSYSGWNGAAYLAGEVKNPGRVLPAALVLGTCLVTLLYLGLNAVFLASAPSSELVGRVEVGHVAAVHLFGAGAGRVLSGLIALALVSSVGAMMLTGPRVYEAMGEDYGALHFLSYRTRSGGPVWAILVQALLALVMLFTASFGSLLTYIGVTLSACTALTVFGVFLRRPEGPSGQPLSHAWGYPVAPGLFLVFSCWMIVHAVIQRPVQVLFSALTVGVGLLLYFWIRKSRSQSTCTMLK